MPKEPNGGFDLKRRSARRVRLGSRRFELAIRRILEGGPQARRAGRFGSIQNTRYSMLCNKQLLRPRFSVQAADILVWTRDAFDSRVHLRASLPATIAREGKLLYVA